jgi:hypothetical protein
MCAGETQYSDCLQARGSGFNSQEQKETFLFSTAFRPVLGPIQSPVKRVSGYISPGVERLER